MGTTVAGPAAVPVRRRAGWRVAWFQTLAALVILAGTCVYLYPQAASWFSQKEQSRVTKLATEALDDQPYDDAGVRLEQLELAHAYNRALASGALLEANAHVAVGDQIADDGPSAYEDLLAVTEAGFMGRLRYDGLAIDLPIYHGTSDETLEHGIGHLEGTSLPVGGVGTRAVLTAHRGLPTSTLFSDLDKANVGDIFSLTVLGQVLTYQVIETQVIAPEETKAIIADPERDLVTLVTCTPLGINSHRILVTGERITPTPIEEVAKAAVAPELPGFPWWAVIFGAVTLAVVGYIWRAGCPPKRRPARAQG